MSTVAVERTSALPVPIGETRHPPRRPVARGASTARRPLPRPTRVAGRRRRRDLRSGAGGWVAAPAVAAATARRLVLHPGPGSPTVVPVVVGQTYAQAQSRLSDRAPRRRAGRRLRRDGPQGRGHLGQPRGRRRGAPQHRRRAHRLQGPGAVCRAHRRRAAPRPRRQARIAANQAHARRAQARPSTRRSPEGLVVSDAPRRPAPRCKRGDRGRPSWSARAASRSTVTDFTGKPADQAVDALTDAGLKVDATKQENSDTVPKGSVISQTPPAARCSRATQVTLVVSKGPVLVKRARRAGQAGAPRRARSSRPPASRSSVERFMGGIFGTVRSQNPAGGSKAPKGSTVTLVVV